MYYDNNYLNVFSVFKIIICLTMVFIFSQLFLVWWAYLSRFKSQNNPNDKWEKPHINYSSIGWASSFGKINQSIGFNKYHIKYISKAPIRSFNCDSDSSNSEGCYNILCLWNAVKMFAIASQINHFPNQGKLINCKWFK